MAAKNNGGRPGAVAAGPGADRSYIRATHGQYSPDRATDQLPRRQFVLRSIAELTETITAPSWLVRGILEADTLAVLYGDPAAGKSFLALDLALSVATGRGWRGHEVAGGPVIYLAGEGHHGLARRARAWSIARAQPLVGAPAYISGRPALLSDELGATEVTAAIDALHAEHGPPRLIVVDTLARHNGGDESSTRDMSALVDQVDAIRRHYGCAVLLVHHVGHADKTRARGSIALRAAVDSEYRITREEGGTICLAVTKMKDAPAPEPMAFRLRGVELPIVDGYGSAVLDPIDYTPPRQSTAPRGERQRQALDVLVDLTARAGELREEAGLPPEGAMVMVGDWLTACREQGMDRRRIPAARDSLERAGHIIIDGAVVRLARGHKCPV